MQGDTRRAAEFAQQALDGLPDANLFACSMQGVATSILGDARSSVGDLDGAGRAYTDAVRIGRAAENTPMAIIANSNLAGVLLDQGRLQAAARAYRESLALATRPDGQQWPLAIDAHAGLAIISHEWNQLEAAEHHVHQILGLCRQWGPRDMQAVAEALLARLHQIRGNAEDAQQAARTAEELAAVGRFSVEWSTWLNAGLARFWIAHGKLEKASSFLIDCMATADGDLHAIRLPEYLAFVRLLVARGETDAGLELSARLLAVAETAGRMGQVVESLVLRAVALRDREEAAESLAALHRALALAQGEGYVRVFVDEGPLMAKLLHQVAAHASGSEYAEELLSAMRKASGKPAAAAQPLIEPLTGRELEVLKLIEAGYSNQEIASRLVISVATLKRHITNLYAKLGVGSRTQALSAGRELKIIT
jgi:LuxR family maltose regulon positive regulatory protein